MAVTEREFNPSGSVGIDRIKEKALELEQVIREECGLGPRRMSIALTHLETASMYAVKAVARGDA